MPAGDEKGEMEEEKKLCQALFRPSNPHGIENVIPRIDLRFNSSNSVTCLSCWLQGAPTGNLSSPAVDVEVTLLTFFRAVSQS